MLRVAIVQAAPVFMKLDASLDKTVKLVREAAQLGAKVFDEERILIANLDLDAIDKESMTLDVTGHYHRPDIFDVRLK